LNIEFASPPLLSAAKKLDGAIGEMQRLEEFMGLRPFDTDNAAMRWSAVTTVASAIHNIYNGIEDVMKVVCREVDDYVPGGSSSHQAILDQVSTSRKGVRPALIDDSLQVDLEELRAFRHVVNHNYANELREDRVLANLDLGRSALPRFIDAMIALDDFLSSPEPSGSRPAAP
jgi:hypothetical protein